jgi:hypothetical protein
MLSIVTITLTIYSGLYYLSGIGEIEKIVVAIITIGFNALFVIVWVLTYLSFVMHGTKIMSRVSVIMPKSLVKLV